MSFGRNEKANEGLPSSEEYRPEATNDVAVRAAEPDQQYPEYGLDKRPLEYQKPVYDDDGSLTDHEWVDTGRRLVRRNGEFVADVSDRFKLVPNEKVVAAANDAARELGAVPFNDFSGDWYIPLDGHVYQDAARHRVHALYAWDDPVDVGGGDTIQFGFAVHNSIDGSQSFEVGLFSFRHACANMVLMGVGGEGMNFDNREVLAHTTRHHTDSLDVSTEELTALIEETMTFAPEISETYRAWREEVIEPQQVVELIDRLPDSDLPEWISTVQEGIDKLRTERALDALGVDEDADPSEIDQSLLSEVQAEEVLVEDDDVETLVDAARPDSQTAWETYNAITESVWHSDTSNDQTKDRKFSKLHRVMEPAEGVR